MSIRFELIAYVLLYRAMACPYFYPVVRFDSGEWAIPPRLPLGDPYTGECRAATTPIQPGESLIRDVCNVGYGRKRCEHFPDSGQADSIRFNILEDKGVSIRLHYVFERGCWPGDSGVLECSGGSVTSSDPILERQAAAFLESYLRRRD